MRTTINIDDHLFAALKSIAARTGKTLTAVIHDALRDSLARRGTSNRPPIKLRVFNGTGLMPGVDLNDSASLLDLMEEDNGSA